ncbi:MAG: purine-nucleoside phosphorylase [Calditrichia bacterium]
MTELRKKIQEAVEYINSQNPTAPEVGIILGTGLGRLAEEIEKEMEISYEKIPHFPVSTVEGHAGKLIFGKLGGKNVVAMQGRFHYYEGYTGEQVTFPVRVMKFLGIDNLLISNASGGMNPLFRRGDLMMIVDHINLQGFNPLIGPNDDELGPRFPDMSEPYSKKLIELGMQVALENNIYVHQGVYVGVTGPNLETRAEYRFLRAIGADAVGMSTVPEVIAAVHMGMSVFAMSVITDECFPESLKPVSHQEIMEAANIAEPKLTTIMKNLIAKL